MEKRVLIEVFPEKTWYVISHIFKVLTYNFQKILEKEPWKNLFWVKLHAYGNEIDYYSLFLNLFVDFKKTESFIYIFVLILYNIVTFFFEGGLARLPILSTSVDPVLLSIHFLMSTRFWIYSFIVRTVHAHNFAEKLRLVILVTSYLWEYIFYAKNPVVILF